MFRFLDEILSTAFFVFKISKPAKGPRMHLAVFVHVRSFCLFFGAEHESKDFIRTKF